MTSAQRDRAEAAFGHVQRAASEMIAAAHDALDLVDQVVSSAALGEALDTFDHLSQSLFRRGRPRADGKSPRTGEAQGEAQEQRHRPPGPVQRISVR